ncbi:MAG: 4-alpha-glucanotransferase [Lachnospiraceae bacterium]|nr:4-alpha-glucanotransferase [Lachnospiraceae bacterium]
MKKSSKQVCPRRTAGILVHPTSFPGPYGIGDLGPFAYRFIDFLKQAGMKLWQVLPLGPTGSEGSPYQSYSSFAGQPLLISPEKCADYGLLTQSDLDQFHPVEGSRVDYANISACKEPLYQKAFQNFLVHLEEDTELSKEFKLFKRRQKDWLLDYSLFMALKKHFDGKSWHKWPKEIRRPEEKTKKRWRKELAEEITYQEFLQFIFYKQWSELREYANSQGIFIIGDIPIFVSDDSADIWANPELFYVTKDGFPTVVSGVPPDYFSATGQLWGNPLYKWPVHKALGYTWWIGRIKAQLALYDYLRIDHFRAFQDYWSIPAKAESALEGKWKPGPRDDFFFALKEALGENLPIIAEDLGIITDEVRALKERVGLPGMKVLQFAFDGNPHNDYLPHSFSSPDCVCYSGTHDNNTTLGWYHEADEKTKDLVRCYMNTDGVLIHWDFIRTCFGTVADKAIVPIQDIFGQDEHHRMNIPGVALGNWGYRFKESDLTHELSDKLLFTARLYGRTTE